MSNIPNVAWRIQDKTIPTLINFGTVDAGSQSMEVTLYVTNNFPESGVGNPDYKAVSKMENCRVTTKSNTGGLDGDIIEEKWVAIHCDTLNQVDEQGDKIFFPVGSDEIVEDGKAKKIEVASFVSAKLPADYTQDAAPTAPTDKQVWCDTSKRHTLGDVYKRYNAEISKWEEINEISGEKWSDDTYENNLANFVKVVAMATVPSSALAGLRQFKIRIRYSFV